MTELSLREPTFLILTAVAVGAQHGYGIMTDVSQISGGHFGGRDRLPPASPPGLVRGLFRVTFIGDMRYVHPWYRLPPCSVVPRRAPVPCEWPPGLGSMPPLSQS